MAWLNCVNAVFEHKKSIQDRLNLVNIKTNYKNRKQMMEYARVILPKVSFSRELFRKELTKCINWVGESELKELKEWCYENFMEMYPDILTDAFAKKKEAA